MNACRHSKGGFTLIELMASIAILGIMTFLLFAAFDQTSKAWLQGESRVETFSSARAALDSMTRELSQAMVNSNTLQFLGTSTNVAFIAPLYSGTNAVDLMEIVYVLSNTGPGTCSLVRRASAYGSPSCVNYGTKPPSSCTGNSPWDFYSSPPNPNWPETSDPTLTADLADNITWLQFTFYDTNGNAFVYWNSTANPNGLAWSNENAPGLPSGIVSSTMFMTNRPPPSVGIQIGAIDSRTATRLQAIAPTGTNAANVGVVTNMLIQATKYFTTFVEIPNK